MMVRCVGIDVRAMKGTDTDQETRRYCEPNSGGEEEEESKICVRCMLEQFRTLTDIVATLLLRSSSACSCPHVDRCVCVCLSVSIHTHVLLDDMLSDDFYVLGGVVFGVLLQVTDGRNERSNQ